MRNSTTVNNEIETLRSQAAAILDKVEAEGRSPDEKEQAEFDSLFAKIENAQRELSNAIKAERIRSDELMAKHGRPVYDKDNPFDVRWVRDGGGGVKQFRDSNGNVVKAFSAKQMISEPGVNANLVGELVQAACSGLKSWHSDEVRNTMSTGSNPNGGYLLTPAMWAGLVDLARSKARMIEAGCSTVVMPTKELLIAAVASDPEFVEKAENEKFPGTEVTLRQISLSAKTIGNYVTMSRELAADASNAAELIADVLARSLAVAIDQRALAGNGSANFDGLLNRSDIANSGTTSVGAIEWADLHTAATAVRVRNHEPTAAILNPEIYGDLVTTFGVDTWTDAPPSLQGVSMLPTTSCELAKALVGDFRYAIFGVRQQPLLEISFEAGETFERHQVRLKLTWRGDFQVTDVNAFHRLEGITS
ncbi:phage major capsid protein [Pirellulaceae bacterium SH467]